MQSLKISKRKSIVVIQGRHNLPVVNIRKESKIVIVVKSILMNDVRLHSKL